MEQHKSDINQYAGCIYNFVNQYIKLNEEGFYPFLPFLEVRSFVKGEEVLQYGQTEDYLNLVAKGLIRKYVLVGKNDKTLQLAVEGHLIHSEVSFHTRLPSTVTIQAIEPSVLVSIRFDKVQFVFDNIPVAEQIGREMMTDMFIKKDTRYLSQLNYTTRQRFLHYLRHHQHMLKRVPQKILASYLEIKPETFSRLKHLLKN